MNRNVANRIFSGSAVAPREGGFTLLEVLIAVVVLSFGILGVVGLQAASLQANRDARLQSSAVRLARELADMMRGNKNVAIVTAAGVAAGQNPYLTDTASGAYPAAPQNCFSSACSSATNVGTFEMQEWLQRVANELPGARVAVCFDTDPYDADGKPKWTCTGTGAVSVVKIGWTRMSTNRAASSPADALVRATTPTVVLPLLAGS